MTGMEIDEADAVDVGRILALSESIIARARGRKAELGLSQENLEVIHAQACGAFERGDHAAGERTFALLCYVDPFAERHWLGLALCRQKQGRHAEAIKAYSIAAEMGSTNPLIPFYAAQSYVTLGLLEEAIGALRQAIDWDAPEHAAAQVAARARQLLNAIERRLS